jgi:hypothetical protein
MPLDEPLAEPLADPLTDPLADLEAAYLAALDARDATNLARATDAAADLAGLESLAAARSVDAHREMAAVTGRAGDRLSPENRHALEAIREGLAEVDADAVHATQPAAPPPEDAETWSGIVARGGPGLLASLQDAFATVGAALPAPGGPAARLSVLARLASEPDTARRRELFLALEPLWRLVDGDGGSGSPYRRAIADAVPAWRAGKGSLARNAAALGIDRRDIETWATTTLAAWRGAVVEPARAAGAPPLEPWDWWWIAGEAERAAGGLPSDVIRRIARDVHAAVGADFERLGITIETAPAPGRPPTSRANALWARRARQGPGGDWTAAAVRVVGDLADGGLDELSELMHLAGHAIHMAGIRTRPAFATEPEADALTEGIADLLAFDVAEPAWQRRWLPGGRAVPEGVSLRSHYAATVLDAAWALFEMRLLADPSRRPNDVWTELTATWLGIAPHPEWSWWAIRSQLIDEPGYMANYALGAVLTTELRAAIRRARGDWTDGDPELYPWIREHLVRFGRERAPGDVVRGVLGRAPTADALLVQIARAARAPRVV